MATNLNGNGVSLFEKRLGRQPNAGLTENQMVANNGVKGVSSVPSMYVLSMVVDVD